MFFPPLPRAGGISVHHAVHHACNRASSPLSLPMMAALMRGPHTSRVGDVGDVGGFTSWPIYPQTYQNLIFSPKSARERKRGTNEAGCKTSYITYMTYIAPYYFTTMDFAPTTNYNAGRLLEPRPAHGCKQLGVIGSRSPNQHQRQR
jgi:hypothetical protein